MQRMITRALCTFHTLAYLVFRRDTPTFARSRAVFIGTRVEEYFSGQTINIVHGRYELKWRMTK